MKVDYTKLDFKLQLIPAKSHVLAWKSSIVYLNFIETRVYHARLPGKLHHLPHLSWLCEHGNFFFFKWNSSLPNSSSNKFYTNLRLRYKFFDILIHTFHLTTQLLLLPALSHAQTLIILQINHSTNH